MCGWWVRSGCAGSISELSLQLNGEDHAGRELT